MAIEECREEGSLPVLKKSGYADSAQLATARLAEYLGPPRLRIEIFDLTLLMMLAFHMQYAEKRVSDDRRSSMLLG